jgi:glycosyltransferase involved in cell wall biosynthesis
MLGVTVSSCAESIKTSIIHTGCNYDIIQIHGAWPAGLAAPNIADIFSIPFVVTLHIEDDPKLYSTSAGKKIYECMAERASAIVAVGSPLERFIQRIIPELSSTKLVRIPNGITLECMPPASDQRENENNELTRIISVCNLWHLKGIDLNLEALARLKEKGLAGWEYVVVGDGPERKNLARQAADLGISEQVVFTGRLSHDEAMRRMSNADIFSMPSRSESFGMVYLEAMAYGKPAIGCSGTGAEDIIVQGKTGLLVPKENIEGLAEALENLMSNRTWAKQLGEAGRKRAALFSWQSTAEQYNVLYQEVLRAEKSVCAGQEAM